MTWRKEKVSMSMAMLEAKWKQLGKRILGEQNPGEQTGEQNLISADNIDNRNREVFGQPHSWIKAI